MCKCGWQILEMVILSSRMSRRVLEKAGRMTFSAMKLTLIACPTKLQKLTFSKSDVSKLVLEVDATAEGLQAYLETILDCSNEDLPDLVSVSDSLDGEDEEMPNLVLVSDSSEDSGDRGNDDSADDKIGGSFDVPI
jgi:hypothetical protein